MPKKYVQWRCGSPGFRENKDSIRNYSTGCFCHLLVNRSAAFCLYPENLSVTKSNGNGLMCLPEMFLRRGASRLRPGFCPRLLSRSTERQRNEQSETV